MNIASLGTTQTPQSFLAATGIAASASSTQGAFNAQLQPLLAGQSSTGSSAAQTAYQTEPGRGVSGRAHHYHGHDASGADANAADGMDNGQTSVGTQASGTSSTGQQAPGGVMLGDLMRGLQAYGATTTL